MQNRLFKAIISLIVTAGVVWPVVSEAGNWPSDSSVNLPICANLADQMTAMAVEDGYGGAIIVWLDYRNYTGRADIYAQRVDADGYVQWTVDGVAICADTVTQEDPQIVSDGAGGAIIAWVDRRGSDKDIYARRVDANGNALWTANGVAICTYSQDQDRPRMIADGSGGAIIAWQDRRLPQQNIYCQRVDSNGNILWSADGEKAFPNPLACGGSFGYHDITTDGAGGMIMAVMQNPSPTDIVAQRVDSNGNYLWHECGETVCGAANNQIDPLIVEDGSGGAIIAWIDTRTPPAEEMYAQRVNSSGNVQWTTNGVSICTGTGTWIDPEFDMITDGAGGAIIAWNDYNHSSPHIGIFSQRVDASGNTLWTANGQLVYSGYDGYYPEMVSDDLNGAIVVWNDIRIGGSIVDLYAQRLNSSGSLLWATTGVAVTTAPGEQSFPTIVRDGGGGAIMAWEDNRNLTQFDIYAQRITADGELGSPIPVPTLSEWGLIVAVIIMLLTGAALMKRRKGKLAHP